MIIHFYESIFTAVFLFMDLKEQRKEQQVQQKKNDITVSAKILFYEKGISQTTMEDIAKKADFSVGALYSFFPSKRCFMKKFYEKSSKSFWK
jgi:AcrR family transcriptional regulator